MRKQKDGCTGKTEGESSRDKSICLAVVSHKHFYRDEKGYCTTGGFGRYIEALSPFFNKIILCVPVIHSPTRRRNGYYIQKENICFEELPPYEMGKGWRLKWNYCKVLPLYILKLSAFISQCEIVHPLLPSLVGFIGLFWIRIFNKPSFIWLGGDWSKIIIERKSSPFRRMVVRLYNRLLPLLIDSITTFTTGEDIYAGLKKGGARVILVTATTISRTDIVEHSSSFQREKSVHLLFSGRIDPMKGIDYLIKAIALLSANGLGITLDIIGEENAYSTRYRDLARSMDVAEKIHFIGFVPWGERLLDYYRKSDIFVLPSLSEGTPKVLIEAMASGVPVIATRVGGIPSMITDARNGLLIAPHSAEHIAEAVTLLINNTELRGKIINNGLQTARRHVLENETLKRMEIMKGIYPDLMTGKGLHDVQ